MLPPSKYPVSSQKVVDLKKRMDLLDICEEDLDERFVRAQGPGGQKVNKTSSAVYLCHKPSKTEVKSQAHRSQIMNRYLARKLLVEKLEEEIRGIQSARTAKNEKIRRQKQKRSKRAKNKILREKKRQSVKKQSRKTVNPGDS
jgi:peptide chain release factor